MIKPEDLGIGALFWRMRDAVTVSDAVTGKPVLWNPAAERIFGYTAEEAAGLPPGALIPESRREEVMAELATYLATGHSKLTDSEGALEYPILRKDGTQLTIEATVSPLDAPGPDGRPGRYLLAISRDVTERKRAEEQRTRRARHAALRADVAAALAIEGSVRQILQACAEAMVRHLDAAFARIWTLSEADDTLELQASAGLYTHIDGGHARVPVGKFKIGLIAQERRPHLTNSVQTDPRVGDREWAAREGMVAFAGYPLLVEDDLVGVMAMFARQPLHEDTLEALAGVADAIAQGIERRRVLEALHAAKAELEQRAEELQRSNRDLEQFAYVASHDLQEPLRTVVSYLQLLEEDYRDALGDTGKEFLDFAVDGARRMQSLIDDLLQYSRIGSRGKPPAAVDGETVLAKVLADLQTVVEEARATVTHDTLPVVRADQSQLAQLFQNLVANALKFRGDDPPRVHIAAQQEGAFWRFSVSDNGIGIDAEYHDQIFVIFQRLHVRDEYPGSGIGLAVCKRIVERHGGRLWVESTPGQGSVFHFTLPAAEGAK